MFYLYFKAQTSGPIFTHTKKIHWRQTTLFVEFSKNIFLGNVDKFSKAEIFLGKEHLVIKLDSAVCWFYTSKNQ